MTHVTDAITQGGLLIMGCAVLASVICLCVAQIVWLRSTARHDGPAHAQAASAQTQDAGRLILMLFGITLVGAVAGMSGGLSRVGVVGDIIPAALGVIGSVAVYLFGAKPENNAPVALATAGFALALGLGYAAGAENRKGADALAQLQDTCFAVFSNPDILTSDVAFRRAVHVHGSGCSKAAALQEFRLRRGQTGVSLEGLTMQQALDFANARNISTP